MDFGFDPSLIINQMNHLDDVGLRRDQLGLQQQQARGQEETRRASLAEMLYRQGRERSLADIVSQNSGSYSDPTAQAFAQGGFSDEATQAQQRAMSFDKLHGDVLASKLAPIATQADWDKALAGISDQGKQRWGIPDKFDPEWSKSFLASRLSPEQQATQNWHQSLVDEKNDAIGRSKIVQGKDGAFSRFNPLTGEFERITGPTVTPVVGRRGAAPSAGAGGAAGGPADPLAGLKANEVEKKWKEFTDSISTVKGRANLNAQLQNRLYASERVKNAALDENGNIKNLDPTMLNEVAAGTASLLANGSAPAEHTVQQFLPKGRGMGQASLLEWLTNDPQGANQQGFIKQMVNLSKREEALIGTQMRSGQMQALPNYMGLRKRDASRFDSILKGAGLDPSGIDENGLPVSTKGADAVAGAGMVTVRRKSDGVQKTLPASAATRYLADPAFEKVQ